MDSWFGLAAGLGGWAGGLLVDYLADILPAQRGLAAPACPVCQAPRPALRYMPWPRACLGCGRKPALRNWLAPAWLAAAGVWLWLHPPAGLSLALGLLTLVYFTLVVVIDIEHRHVLHITSLAGVLLGLAVGWERQGLAATVLGGLAALLIMLAIYFLGGLFGRFLGRLRGRAIGEVPFGFGDVLLATVIGLMTGWPEVLRSLFIAILAAGAFSLVYLTVMLAQRRYRLGTAIPYAPFLIIGAISVFLFMPISPIQ
jgi:leader peptidase (prepilin peptidase)/N-methyltransferase